MITHRNGKSINLSQPLIVGVVSGPKTLKSQFSSEDSDTCDLLEFRIDALVDHLKAAEDSIRSSPLPALITVRDPAEGGEGHLDADERIALYERFLPLAGAIDIEIRNLEKFSELIIKAKQAGVAVIASFHDFTGFPEAKISALLQSPPDMEVLKIAVYLDSRTQLESLFSLFAKRLPDHPTAVMGMGELGPQSRHRALQSGSILNYGYLETPNAPGQSSVRELRKALTEIRAEAP